jgi:hypothetical protein
MSVDHERLIRMRRYEDPEAGISEAFLARRIGPCESLVLLSAPLREPRSLGVVVCPSVGPEHGNLRRLETQIAGSLAGEGFPVLRVRPDVHPARGPGAEIELGARLAEVEEAADLVREECCVDEVVLLGALFGGTVAALTADRVGAVGIALVDPVVRGRQYVRETIRRQAIAELVAADEEPAAPAAENVPEGVSAPTPLEELEIQGHTSLRGLLLSRVEYERITAVDLAAEPPAFGGASLLVGISPSGTASRGLSALEERLRSLGGEVTLELVQDPLPAPFGEYYYRNVGGVRVDTRLELDVRLAAIATAWAVETFPGHPRRAAA